MKLVAASTGKHEFRRTIWVSCQYAATGNRHGFGSLDAIRHGFCPAAWPRQAHLQALPEETKTATPDRRIGGISIGGILVIVGILILTFWSFWLGLIVALIGLVAFGGFVRGRWY
jgi:hypothetical protein